MEIFVFGLKIPFAELRILHFEANRYIILMALAASVLHYWTTAIVVLEVEA
jgi:hypothetical protein